jgi:hypothetical protein
LFFPPTRFLSIFSLFSNRFSFFLSFWF